MTFEEVFALFIEVETVLNSRALSYIYNEYDQPQPLIPMHLLNIGQPNSKYLFTFETKMLLRTAVKAVVILGEAAIST